MPTSLLLTDEHVVKQTRRLVAYLRELVEQSSDPVRATIDDTTVWLGDYCENLTPDDPSALLEVRRPAPAKLGTPAITDSDAFRRLESLARRAAELSDTHELVVGFGLLSVSAVGRKVIRRHLLTCPADLVVDAETETIRLRPLLRLGLQLEDRDFLNADDGFDSDRELSSLMAARASQLPLLTPEINDWLTEWCRRCWKPPLRVTADDGPPPSEPSDATLSPSPALLLRQRNSSRLVEYYEHIATYLERPGAAAPLGLAQLITPIPHAEKLRLLEQTSRTTLLDDADPLMPLPSNAEQRRILDALRSDTAVVIQGPPGTGKTHTIANLICALLADGQRILITSAKGQALRVLQRKLPPKVRNLCVLATGQRRGADDELDRSITALSQLQTGTDIGQLARNIDRLSTHRADLLYQHKAALSELQIIREEEYTLHSYNVARYSGTMLDIVRALKADRSTYEWIGSLPPTAADISPLTGGEAVELLTLIRTASPERVTRSRQRLPSPDLLPEAVEINTAFACLTEVDDLLGPDRPHVAPLLNLDGLLLNQLTGLIDQAADVLNQVGLSEGTEEWGREDWRLRAAHDRFERRNPEFWATQHVELTSITNDRRVQAAAAGTSVVLEPDAEPVRLLGQARRLRAYLVRGRRIRRYLPASPAQLDAEELLDSCTVDGLAPTTPASLLTAITHLSAEVTVESALRSWSVTAPPATRLSGKLAQLRDIERSVAAINTVTEIRDRIEHTLQRHGIRYHIRTAAQWDRTVRAIRAAPLIARARTAQQTLSNLVDELVTLAHDPNAAPEITELTTALRERDIARYTSARVRVIGAVRDRDREHRYISLLERLRAHHPDLADRLLQTSNDTAWDSHLPNLQAAWAWAGAVRYHRLIESMDGGAAERRLNDLETQLGDVTTALAASKALLHCLTRVTAEQRGALQDYRTQMSSLGKGHSEHKQRRLAAARSAMQQAQAAVPAWIMPLADVAEMIDIHPNAFDVVIVDEASQAEMKDLFLLSLAPRIVIVGDERQCAPGLRSELADVHESLDHHLNTLSLHVKESFNPVSNLYELLSARFPGVIRLSEHFRCMPEIIGWSSRQFYQDSLIPLRQFGADRLRPVEVVPVPDAHEEGSSGNPKNPAEAEAIVDRIASMLSDPAYSKKSIGVVVLPNSPAQCGLIDRLIHGRFEEAQLQRHDIRVGQPPDFQGDERDVVLLSMTIVRRRNSLTGRINERRFNVAASRARDQLLLFTSITLNDLKSDDMRHSLLSWMRNPPNQLATDPRLDDAGREALLSPFTSLLQQQVYLDLRERGYAVISQYPVGPTQIGLVVIGDNGRLAIECETPELPATPADLHERLDRDRNLNRADWQFFRVRHSTYTADPDAALQPLWALLEARGIKPGTLLAAAAPPGTTTWTPAPLSPDEAGPEEDLEA